MNILCELLVEGLKLNVKEFMRDDATFQVNDLEVQGIVERNDIQQPAHLGNSF